MERTMVLMTLTERYIIIFGRVMYLVIFFYYFNMHTYFISKSPPPSAFDIDRNHIENVEFLGVRLNVSVRVCVYV